jgi:4-hydroxy-3-methylbut-2-enyl diphosphate reductase
MKINLAKSAGFCFGVRRAIDIALKAAAECKNVYMLGDIVHNEKVVRQIQDAGIKKIKRLSCGKNKILLIRAHGCPSSVYNKAKGLDYNIIDATCPMVKEIHKIAKVMEKKGNRIIVIGDKKHDEVRGIVGQLKKRAIIIDAATDLPLKSLKKITRACVVVQSTQNLDKAVEIIDSLKTYIKDLRFFNTICKPTRTKQQEIKTMPAKNGAMIIIGSKNSANTKRLYEISKSLNARSFWVNSREDIRREWFSKVKSLGVTAGASTPDSTTREIIDYIRSLKG